MKKLMLTLAIIVIAAPAMAAISFTAVDNGDGSITISYTTTDGDLPRGIALALSTDNTAQIDSAAAVDVAFNCNMDYLYSNPTAILGEGHPLALTGAAGEAVGPLDTASLSMGVLDEAGGQAAGPATADLATVVIADNGEASVTVTIAADTLRGPASGVVGSEIASNLPIDVAVSFGEPECFPAAHPDYTEWLSVGSPESWCNPFQCKGDANNDTFGFKDLRVDATDLTTLLNGWKQVYSGDPLVDTWISADFAHDAFGFKNLRVDATDLTILLANWKVAGILGDCLDVP